MRICRFFDSSIFPLRSFCCNCMCTWRERASARPPKPRSECMKRKKKCCAKREKRTWKPAYSHVHATKDVNLQYFFLSRRFPRSETRNIAFTEQTFSLMPSRITSNFAVLVIRVFPHECAHIPRNLFNFN